MRPTRNRLNWLLPLLLLLRLPAEFVAYAQESDHHPLYLGIGGGYERGLLYGNIPVMSGSNECAGEFTDGRATAISVWGEFSLPELLSSSLGIALRASWRRSTTLFAADPGAAYAFVSAESGELVQVVDEYRLRGDVDAVRLDARLLISPAPDWSIGIGPWAGTDYKATYSITDAVASGDLRFQGGAHEIPLAGGTTLTGATFSAGGSVMMRYSHRFGTGLILTPELSLRAALTSPAREASWRDYNAMLGAMVAFDLNPDQTSQFRPSPSLSPSASLADTLVSTPAERRPPSATLALYGLSESGGRLPAATISVYDILYRQQNPLTPTLYFDRGSASISGRYITLSQSEAVSFTVDSLADSLPEAQRHILNILGKRMQEMPGSGLTLTGSASADESSLLARERAGSIVEYLHQVWGIDATRLKVMESRGTERGVGSRSRQQGVERSVTLSSSSPGLLAPVVSQRIVRDVDPPAITVDPEWQADGGLRNWTIELVRGEDTVGRFSSSDSGRYARLHWEITGERDSASLPRLEGRLMVVDSLGRYASARAEIPMILERRMRFVDRNRTESPDRERITYTLLPFDPSSDLLGRRNREVIDKAAAAVRSGGVVVVSGNAVSGGDDGQGNVLNRRRVASTAAAIRDRLRELGRNATVTESASPQVNVATYLKDLPEEWALPYQITITIRQRRGSQPAGGR